MPEWKFDAKPALVMNHMQAGIAGTGKFSEEPHSQEKKQMEGLDTIQQQIKPIATFRERKFPSVFISVMPNSIDYLTKWGFIFEMNKKPE